MRRSPFSRSIALICASSLLLCSCATMPPLVPLADKPVFDLDAGVLPFTGRSSQDEMTKQAVERLGAMNLFRSVRLVSAKPSAARGKDVVIKGEVVKSLHTINAWALPLAFLVLMAMIPGDRYILTLKLTALDARTGEQLWQRSLTAKHNHIIYVGRPKRELMASAELVDAAVFDLRPAIEKWLPRRSKRPLIPRDDPTGEESESIEDILERIGRE